MAGTYSPKKKKMSAAMMDCITSLVRHPNYLIFYCTVHKESVRSLGAALSDADKTG